MTTDPVNTSIIQAPDVPLAPTEADLRVAYEGVVYWQTETANRKALLASLREAFDAEHDGPIGAVKSAEALLGATENSARALTIAAYEADPAHRKDVLPGCLGIREVVAVGYDPEAALAWAKEHSIAVRLDERAYEKLVKQGLAPGTLTTGAVATIARQTPP